MAALLYWSLGKSGEDRSRDDGMIVVTLVCFLT
jgi:hypothetical protein